MNCRFDGQPLAHEFVDLGYSPVSNSFRSQEDQETPEVYYPLKLWVSERTFLVQTGEYKKAAEIFSGDYVYFSSYSKSWLRHASQYVEKMVEKFGLNATSQVVEIASNDGYLLQYFKQKNIPCYGVEPSGSVAGAAREKGIETLELFFGVETATKLAEGGRKADLLLGNNVLAHVPDLNDFVKGLKILLKPQGVVTMEFPHLMQLVEQNQFDTIYHEHFSYFSFYTVCQVFRSHGLEMFDVEEIPTHGGSLRIYAAHEQDKSKTVSPSVAALLLKEREKGMQTLDYYGHFQPKVEKVKRDFLKFLLDQRSQGKTVAAYGAAAKGNTLLNYCGVRRDLISFVCDASPHKQGKFLPGSHIPVFDPVEIEKRKPDFVVILPWNIREEIMEQLSVIRQWGGKFVVAVPCLQTL